MAPFTIDQSCANPSGELAQPCSVPVEDMSKPVTLSVTGMVCGELKAPGALTVKLPEYVPAPSPLILACTFVEEGAVPEALDSVNHGVFALTFALQFTVPAP